jgi:hypothetical protein
LEESIYICPNCNHYLSMPLRARIALLAMFGHLAYAISKMEKSNRKPKPPTGPARRGATDKVKIPAAAGMKRTERQQRSEFMILHSRRAVPKDIQNESIS